MAAAPVPQPIVPSPVPATPPAPVAKAQSFEQKLENVGNDVLGFFKKVAADWQKAKAAWTLISSPQTRALALKITADAVTVVKDAEGAVASEGLNFSLDQQTVTDIKQLLADAKAGEGVIVSDLKVLGITL